MSAHDARSAIHSTYYIHLATVMAFSLSRGAKYAACLKGPSTANWITGSNCCTSPPLAERGIQRNFSQVLLRCPDSPLLYISPLYLRLSGIKGNSQIVKLY